MEKEEKPEPVYPPEGLPSTYTDGVFSISWQDNVVKMYLVRYMPEVFANGTTKQIVHEQLVIPKMAFLLTAAIIERQVANMIAGGFVTPEDLEALKKLREAS